MSKDGDGYRVIPYRAREHGMTKTVKKGDKLHISRHSVLDTESKMLNQVQHDTKG
jgi:hypothetical protein